MAATAIWLRPSKKILSGTHILAGLTVGSGGILAWGAQVPLLQACVLSLGYLGAIGVGTVRAHAHFIPPQRYSTFELERSSSTP